MNVRERHWTATHWLSDFINSLHRWIRSAFAPVRNLLCPMSGGAVIQRPVMPELTLILFLRRKLAILLS